MLKLFNRRAARSAPEPFIPSIDDRRVYAIGDIHGRADLFDELLEAIDRDNGGREGLPTELVLLGDLVDRGPESARVMARALQLAESGAPVRFLKGNHEEVFIRAARGDAKAARFFLRIGGRETLLSYGLEPQQYHDMDYDAVTDWMLNRIPRDHVDFADGFEDMIEIGDYLFVHAGIRPETPLDAQKSSDLRWIRDEFLSFGGDHGRMVVHGHTITEEVEECRNRIGIDTGAYASGKLTAIGLEGTARWYISTQGAPGEWHGP